MKRVIKQIIFLATLVLFFSNCGSGGSNEGTFDTGETKIDVESCSSGATILQANDLLVKDTANTIITISHLSDDTKSVCVVSGSAHIIREN